ncbi:lantibiotic dehydratase [Mucilaginibacter sp. cycad4]|uniref:lantibiotic dehydratase n=1 Tax=Mucilaginibacter sp. cycad4 TaxID=3342096 RepID=UPI002AAA8224|nr:lantibiotic dehydratase [Mucilaginibacter gossypii]WPU98414.1 lantibiotic dehydratase [Mucilaginibacter gossypii]
MRYNFARDLLLRMPRRNSSDYTTDLAAIVADPLFRTAVLLASPVFYGRLEQSGFRPDLLSDKQQLTLLKYYNRFCFRPTPFGLFSSVTLAQWDDDPVSGEAEVRYYPVIRADQHYQAALAAGTTKENATAEAIFDPNPSVYRVLHEFRFLRSGLNENFSIRNYSLQSIAFSKLLGDLLSFCHGGKSGNELIDFIGMEAGCSPDEADAYLEFLIDAQILLDRSRCNITGADFFEQHANERMQAVSGKLFREHIVEEQYIRQLKSDLRAYLPQPAREHVKEELSVILHRFSTGEVLSSSIQSQIASGIDALSVLVPDVKNTAMQAFARQFNTYFEGQCIPLLTALDPEAGIGYHVPESDQHHPLLETLHIPLNTPVEDSMVWTAGHSLLLERWHGDQFRQTHVIHLQADDLTGLQSGQKPPAVLGMSVLFRLAGQQVVIESAGGNNAPALLGRFTVGDPAITEAAKAMAKNQEAQNPGVIFAELLHLSDPHTDNINRREQIWQYELPVSAVSLLPVERQLELSDLCVAVHTHQVFLYSKKHQKVVVPRLTSAYNHSLNKLPLFRFLADIPYQYGRNSLVLDLRQFFPGLGFYPRVEFGETILFAATWVIREAQLNKLGTASMEKNLQQLQILCEELRIPDVIAIAEGDQHLHFGLRNPPEAIFFLHCIRNKSEVVLKEVITGEQVRQYNAYLLPDEVFKLPPSAIFKHHSGERRGSRRKYIPGSEWLYLKIYAPKISASRLLLKLRPILRKRFSHGKIRRWFFVRYEDHAPHLRVRMLVDRRDINEVLGAFKVKLEDRIRQHVVREYQVDVYSRELERYHYAGIEKTEIFFWASSELVLQAISSITGPSVLFLFALRSTLEILRNFIQEDEDLVFFCYQSYARFLTEFKVTKLHVELDRKYRKLQKEIEAALVESNEKYLSAKWKSTRHFLRTIRDLAQNRAGDTPEKNQFLSSIVHMHVNRIFTDEPRKQEMVTYYFLYKFLLAKKGRAKHHGRIPPP